jgi:hypothetical protein
MAVIEESPIEVKGGFTKQIDAGATSLMFEILQKHQYQFPIKSTVREIVCNSLDSVKERDMALEILSGVAKVEDYYVEKEGDLFKDSKFDKSYYNPEFLSQEPNVFVNYYEGQEMNKDRIEIKDYGVGLWGQRLVGYWNLGYSSKRLNLKTIGKFGIGNKSPLSINDTFTTITVYNGRRAKFNVYSNKVESITPKFDLESGEENESHTVILADGTPYAFYTEKTTEKNSLTVIIEAKKHHKEQYIEAVQGQLLYFSNVKLTIYRANGSVDVPPVSSPVLYEDSKIVISDNNYYLKPHIVVNGVNYGYVNFDELELEEKFGNIGIKVQPEEIDISPSRESLIWNDTTKNTVVKRFHECAEIATKLIQAELNEPDFVKWLRVCTNISSRHWDKTSTVSRLANIIDIKSISPRFMDTKIKYTHDIFDPVHARYVSIETKKKANQEITKVGREPIKFLGDKAHLPIIVCTDKVSNRKDKYLLSSMYKNGFILVQQKDVELIKEQFLGAIKLDDNWTVERKIKGNEEAINLSKELFELIKKSSEAIDYDTIIVPPSFNGTDDEEDVLEDEEEQSAVRLSHDERRKLEGKTVLFTPRNKSAIHESVYNPTERKHETVLLSRFYEWQKVEVPIKEINDWDAEEIYYATDKTAEMMEFVALLTRDTRQENFVYPRAESKNSNPTFDSAASPNYGISPDGTRSDERYRCSHYYFNKNIKLIKVSEANSKLYRDFYPISNFFLKFKNNRLTMSNILIKWNTARKILPSLNKIAFLFNYSFNPEKQALYRSLVEYVKSNYRDVLDFKHKENNIESAHNDLTLHLDKVTEFQMFLATKPSSEEIQKVSQELWGNSNITEACAIDYELWNSFQELLEWARPIATMLNQVDALTGVDAAQLTTPNSHLSRKESLSLPEELEQEIRWYSKHKSVI